MLQELDGFTCNFYTIIILADVKGGGLCQIPGIGVESQKDHFSIVLSVAKPRLVDSRSYKSILWAVLECVTQYSTGD